MHQDESIYIAGSSIISIIHNARESFYHYMMKACKHYYIVSCCLFFFLGGGGGGGGGEHLWPRGTIYGAMDDPKGTVHSATDGPGGPSVVAIVVVALEQYCIYRVMCNNVGT